MTDKQTQARNLIEKHLGYLRSTATDIVPNLTADEIDAIRSAASDPAMAEETIIDIVATAEGRGFTGVCVEGERSPAAQRGERQSLSARDLQTRKLIERHAGKDRDPADAIVRSLSPEERQSVRTARNNSSAVASIAATGEGRIPTGRN